jgi:serine/threonine-protein kinase
MKVRKLRAGEIIAQRYRIDNAIARGGFAAVWGAWDLKLDSPVALKVLRCDADQFDSAARKRFVQESALMQELDHPNIVRTYDCGEDEDGLLFIVMEKLEGHTLTARLQHRNPPGTIRHVLEQMLEALGYAHQRGLIHRDLKPSNVFLCAAPDDPRPTVKLLDFGFAKLLDSEVGVRLTLVGERVGTPGYMAPEQLNDGAANPKVDLYVVGVLGYEMLTGEQAFKGEGIQRAMAQMKGNPKSPEPELAKLPIYGVISKLLEYNPKHRYASAADALYELGQGLGARSDKWSLKRLFGR